MQRLAYHIVSTLASLNKLVLLGSAERNETSVSAASVQDEAD